uniref:Uncharacterized protein n=1 Tax=viral metagenome TaxID=1070528 RepID=A0A6H1ZSJ5_9ZZZZ
MNGPEPIAVLFGIQHVSIAPISEGWVPLSWAKKTGPRPIGPITERDRALDRARAYVATYPHTSVLDVPDGYDPVERGMIHVDQREGEWLEIMHEGRSGNSFASLGSFDAGMRKRAIAYALLQCPIYGARLGRLLSQDLCLAREAVR